MIQSVNEEKVSPKVPRSCTDLRGNATSSVEFACSERRNSIDCEWKQPPGCFNMALYFNYIAKILESSYRDECYPMRSCQTRFRSRAILEPSPDQTALRSLQNESREMTKNSLCSHVLGKSMLSSLRQAKGGGHKSKLCLRSATNPITSRQRRTDRCILRTYLRASSKSVKHSCSLPSARRFLPCFFKSTYSITDVAGENLRTEYLSLRKVK